MAHRRDPKHAAGRTRPVKIDVQPGIAPVAVMHLTEEPPDLRRQKPGVPPQWATLVTHTLAKNPDQRPTARDLVQRIRDLPAR
jgi:hypothetical protein